MHKSRKKSWWQRLFGPQVTVRASAFYRPQVECLEERTLLHAPYILAAGDFNNDGKADVAVASYQDGEVYVYLGNGNGTFQPRVGYTTGAGSHDVAVGDLNHDGKADLVVANYLDNSLSVLLGNGDGTFQPAVNYVTGAHPHAVQLTDLNHDGNLDAITANYQANTVSVLLGRGDGTLQPAVNTYAGIGPTALAVADFNGDGKLDLAVTDIGHTYDQQGSLSILSGNGSGGFRAYVAYPLVGRAFAITSTDLNGDGQPDLAIEYSDLNTITVFLNVNGTFPTAVSVPTGSNAGYGDIRTADFNGDGKADLVVANGFAGTVSVLLGNDDGTFQPAQVYHVGIDPHAVAVVDVNGDGKLDLVVSDAQLFTVIVLLGNGDGTFRRVGQVVAT